MARNSDEKAVIRRYHYARRYFPPVNREIAPLRRAARRAYKRGERGRARAFQLFVITNRAAQRNYNVAPTRK